MISLKSPQRARRQPQKCKLAKAFQSFQENQQSLYDLVVQRGALQIIINREKCLFNEDQKENEVCNYYNHEESRQDAKKKIGLFANIIKNMENKRCFPEPSTSKNHQQKPRTYTFYFQELDQRSRRNSEKQSRPNTAEVDDPHFENIQITQQTKPQTKIDGQKQDNIAAKAEAFVDLNFSFDEISNNIKSLKKGSAEPVEVSRNSEDTIIRKYLHENSEAELVKDIKLSKGSKVFSEKQAEKPSTLQKDSSRPSFTTKFTKNNKICEQQMTYLVPPSPTISLPKTFLKQSSELVGTKKVESRIISNSRHDNENSIKIDFDLDINFV